MGGVPYPGYISPWKHAHKPLTCTLTLEEHARLSAIAAQYDMPVTTWATNVLREELETVPHDV